jgi:hypothetical protein
MTWTIDAKITQNSFVHTAQAVVMHDRRRVCTFVAQSVVPYTALAKATRAAQRYVRTRTDAPHRVTRIRRNPR